MKLINSNINLTESFLLRVLFRLIVKKKGLNVFIKNSIQMYSSITLMGFTPIFIKIS